MILLAQGGRVQERGPLASPPHGARIPSTRRIFLTQAVSPMIRTVHDVGSSYPRLLRTGTIHTTAVVVLLYSCTVVRPEAYM